jgi:hypothetical protein
MACAPSFLGDGAILVSAHDGGVMVFVVVIAGQKLENPRENAVLGLPLTGHTWQLPLPVSGGSELSMRSLGPTSLATRGKQLLIASGIFSF